MVVFRKILLLILVMGMPISIFPVKEIPRSAPAATTYSKPIYYQPPPKKNYIKNSGKDLVPNWNLNKKSSDINKGNNKKQNPLPDGDPNDPKYWKNLKKKLKDKKSTKKKPVDPKYKPGFFVKLLNKSKEIQYKIFGNKFFNGLIRVPLKIGSAIFNPKEFFTEKIAPFFIEKTTNHCSKNIIKKIAITPELPEGEKLSEEDKKEIEEAIEQKSSFVSSLASKIIPTKKIVDFFGKKLIKALIKTDDLENDKLLKKYLTKNPDESLDTIGVDITKYKQDKIAKRLFKRFGVKDKKIHQAYINGREIHGIASNYHKKLRYIISTVMNTTNIISISYELNNNKNIQTGMKLTFTEKIFKTIMLLRHFADNYTNIIEILKYNKRYELKRFEKLEKLDISSYYKENKEDKKLKKYLKTGFRLMERVLPIFVTLADQLDKHKDEILGTISLLKMIKNGDSILSGGENENE